jgi:NAD(P)-dependent dehydrogenase (short-subunit alcohol dehydrogenase family)
MMLQHKVAIITGAGSGIGEATAILFAKEGAHVMVSDRNESEAKRVAALLGGNGSAVKADVSSESEMKELTQATIDRYGKIDILTQRRYYQNGLRIRRWRSSTACSQLT